jgi:MOSC domain-containing protein YiiM
MIERQSTSSNSSRQHPSLSQRGVLVQINISPGGMPKLPIAEAAITADGVPSDWQNDRKHHGGPDRAICLFSQELYHWLRDDHGISLNYGSVGENFTTRGIDLDSLAPSDRLQIGGCIIQITAVRIPCRNLMKWHPNLHKIIQGHSGWYARVLQAGSVQPGDEIEFLQRDDHG